jgi:ribose 5-phosphate isomerase B
MLTIALGTDHRGYDYKLVIQNGVSLETKHINWIDVGAFSAERSDYPSFAVSVVRAVRSGQAHAGILLCGTGIGMAIAANRFEGIYAGVAWNAEVARRAREEDHVNILVLPADYITPAQSIPIIQAWLEATAKSGRYADRIAMIDKLEGL